MKLPDEVRKHLKRIGRKGGKAKSEVKAIAARENAKKPRRRREK